MRKMTLNWRKVAMIVACLVGVTVFSGCDKSVDNPNDDDNGNNNNGKGKPAAVVNFTATAGSGKVSLAWDTPSNDGGSDITGYEVTMDNWANKVAKTESERSHIYTGLTNGTQYTFKVRAVNDNGTGAESTATATAAPTGSDVYVAGCLRNEKDNRVAIVWKNSEKLYQLTDGERDAYAYSIYVSGDDVYVAGIEDNAAGVHEGRVWKNGQRLYSFTHATQSVYAYSVIVSGNDVYVSGNWHVTGTSNRTGKVWKNGTELYSFDGSVSETKMCILNNDIYVGGQSGGEAQVWKNGVSCWRTNTTNFSPNVHHMYESNGDIYVSFNFTSSTTVYIAKIIQGSYTFNQIWTQSFPSGYFTAQASSFVVSGSDIYVAVNSNMTSFVPQIHTYKNSTAVNSRAYALGKMCLFDDDVYLAIRNSNTNYSLKVYKNETELYILNENGTYLDNIGDIVVVER